jgi:PhnB protein
MYARLDTVGMVITGSDGRPNHSSTAGDNMALALRGTDRERLTKAFNGLAEGGTVMVPLTDQPWGATSGWLTDKFSIIWSISIDQA